MQHQAINATLGLEGLEILAVASGDDLVELVVQSRFEAGPCHSCGGVVPEPKERPEVLIRDLSVSGRPVVLRWRKRRWRCTYCRASWTETHPQIPPRARMTLRFKQHIADQAASQGNFSQVALQQGVSFDTVLRAHRQRAELVRRQRPRPAPKVISIDEAAMRKGRNYNTVITDVVSRYVIDTVQGRTETALSTWFSSLDPLTRDGIEVVVMDLWGPYRAMISRALPDAVIVADKFHVVRLANLALDGVRRRCQGRGSKRKTGWPRRLFDCRFALLRARENARPQDTERLKVVFEVFPEIHEAWRLKESLREAYAATSPAEAALALEVWFQLVARSEIPEFIKLAKTIRHWKTEILNHFVYRMTNAFAEGITNRVKVIKRQGYGFRNFSNFQDRILVQCGTPKAMRIPA
jgi:transposase